MTPVIVPLSSGEKPTEAGWYVANVPSEPDTRQIVYVRELYSGESRPILVVTHNDYDVFDLLETAEISFIARIYPDRIEGRNER